LDNNQQILEVSEAKNAPSEAQEKQKSACAIKTSIGGQALMEGIMMRGPKKTAMAVRNTQGEIIVEESETKGVNRPKICKLPIIRGIFGYIDSMSVGYKALMRSAELSGLEDVVENEEEKKNRKEKGEKNEKVSKAFFNVLSVLSVILAFGIAIGLFAWFPAQLFKWLSPVIPFIAKLDDASALKSLYKSVFEGVLKIVLLVGYMAVISLNKDIKRTFMFHGAEHKTIFCYEAGLPLTVENIRKMKRFHPRCGTSFLILMLLVSIFISFFIDPICIKISGAVLPPLFRALVKILLIPLIVGLGYELIKLAGKHDNLLTRIISAPGVWLQHITVFEPTDDMIECAIMAVERVIPEDGSDKI